MKKIFKNEFSFIMFGFAIDLIIMFIIISALMMTASKLMSVIAIPLLFGVSLDILFGLNIVKELKENKNK